MSDSNLPPPPHILQRKISFNIKTAFQSALLAGIRKFSGFHLKGEYNRSEFSGHRMWGAFDLLFGNFTAETVRIDLLGHEPEKNGTLPSIEGFEEITEIEYGITWGHIRFGSNIDGVFVYHP